MWDDSEFTSPDYSQYQFDDSTDMGGYDQVGQDTMQNYDMSNFWDSSQSANIPEWNQGNEMPMTTQWGSQSFAPGSALSNIMSQSNPNMSLPQLQGEQGFSGFSGSENGGWNMGSIGNTLSQLFSGQGGKGLASVLGALAEGRQNKQASQQNPQIIQQMRQQASPFDQASTGASQMGASSMRDAMQQQLAGAIKDPYGQPIVKAQTDALAQAQAIRDAAAGRRSNNATSSPALIAEQAKIAQNYINSLQNPAGAGMSAGMGGLDQLLAASKSGINGYTSPLMSALGYNTGTATNSAQMNNANGLSTEQKTALIQSLLGSR